MDSIRWAPNCCGSHRHSASLRTAPGGFGKQHKFPWGRTEQYNPLSFLVYEGSEVLEQVPQWSGWLCPIDVLGGSQPRAGVGTRWSLGPPPTSEPLYGSSFTFQAGFICFPIAHPVCFDGWTPSSGVSLWISTFFKHSTVVCRTSEKKDLAITWSRSCYYLKTREPKHYSIWYRCFYSIATWDLLPYTKAIILFIICSHGIQLTWILNRRKLWVFWLSMAAAKWEPNNCCPVCR